MRLRTGFIHDDVNKKYNPPMLDGTRKHVTLPYADQSIERYNLMPTAEASMLSDSLEAQMATTYQR